MVSKKELRERATIRRAEIDQAEKDRVAVEEARIEALVESFVEICQESMKKAAENGKFYVEVYIPNASSERKACNRLTLKMSEFKPKWFSDGYSKDFIQLNW